LGFVLSRLPLIRSAALLAGVCLSGEAGASSAEPLGPLVHPDGPGKYRVRIGAGALLDIIPRNVAESEMRQLPQLTAQARVGLPAGFSADAGFSGLYIANQIALGAAWTYRIRDVSLSVHDRTCLWFGFLGIDGFDTSGLGLLQQPGASVGVAFGEHRFTLTGEAIFSLLQSTTLGDTTRTSRRQSAFAGISGMLVVESPVGRSGILYYGAGLLWTLPDYQAWIAFSDSRLRYAYPRLVFGYEF